LSGKVENVSVEGVEELFLAQHGVCHRRQLLAAGVTRHSIVAQVQARRWQRIHDGVYADFTGRLNDSQRIAAAVLAAGNRACASHETAAALHGFAPSPAVIHVTIPAGRRVRPRPGMAVHRSSRLDETHVHHSRWPPRTTVERTVLDLVDAARSAEEAFGWLAAVCQQRLTSPGRLLCLVHASTELRWRAGTVLALQDIARGAHSQLERAHRRIEERHGLPLSRRQRAERRGGGQRWLNCDYWPYQVRVELDGRLGHDRLRETWRDYRRDNDGVISGNSVLRYGWGDVTTHGCAVAAQTANVLRQAGWLGHIRRCGPRCTLASPEQWSA
jgi:hypothetical protein